MGFGLVGGWLQISATLLVVFDLLNARRIFVRPLGESIRSLLREAGWIVRPPESKTVSLSETARAEAHVFPGRIVEGISPEWDTERKIEWLHDQIGGLSKRIGEEKKLRLAEASRLGKGLSDERRDRIRADEELARLQKARVEGIEWSIVGAVWLLVGLLFSSLA